MIHPMIYDLNCENCVKEVMYKMDLLENMELLHFGEDGARVTSIAAVRIV